MSVNESNIIFLWFVDEILSKIELMVLTVNTFQEKWNLDVQKDFYKNCCDNLRAEVKANMPKLLRDSTHCVVYGRVSTGKSAIINSLLEQQVLPSHFDTTTNSFVEIQKSEDDEKYLIFPENPQRVNIFNITRVDETKKNSSHEGSHVKLYLSSLKSPILKKNIVFVDTPGIDSDISMDSLIQKEIKQSDVLILVISCHTGFTVAEKEFLKKHSTKFSKLKIITLFNFTDGIDSNINHYKSKYTNEVKKYFLDELKIKKEGNEDDIFFISAKERLQIQLNEINSTESTRERNYSFDNFQNRLQEYLADSSEKRCSKIRQHILEKINSSFNSLTLYRENLRTSLNNKIKNISKLLKDFNAQINLEVEYIFEVMYERFFATGLKVVRKNLKKKEEESNDILKEYLEEVMKVITESLKNNIRKLIQNQAQKDSNDIIEILEKIYFQSFLNRSENILKYDVKIIKINFTEIVSQIKIWKKVTIAGIATGGLVIAAASGIFAGVVVPIATPIAATAFGTGGGVLGGVIGGTSSYISTKFRKFKRNAYKPRYDSNERIIKEFWTKMKDNLIDSYEVYMTSLSKNKLIWTEIDNNFNNIQERIVLLKT